jgi:hypothetical protein
MTEITRQSSPVPHRRSLLVLLTVLFLMCASTDLFTLLYFPQYTISDWLINYSAGFVRRGLPGAFFLLLSHIFHIRVAWFGFIFPAGLYAAFLAGVYLLARPLRPSALLYAMLLSPATLPFIVLNGGDIGFRKETLLLAALAMFILLLRRELSDLLLSVALALTVIVLLLSHEAMIFCVPYFFAAASLATKSLGRAAKICTVPFIIALALLVVVEHHPGGPLAARTICSSVGGHWIDKEPSETYPGMTNQLGLCPGSIAWMGVPLDGYQSQRSDFPLWKIFKLRFALAILPFFIALALMYYRDRLHQEVAVIFLTGLVCALGSVALFLSTIDWGRWIYTQSVCLMLVTLLAAQRAPSMREKSKLESSLKFRVITIVVTALYCCRWTVAVNTKLPLHRGYLETARYDLHWFPLIYREHAEKGLGLFAEPKSAP